MEYATVIVCAVAALLTMQVYIKRAYQGKLKQTADSLGAQYAPRRTTGDFTTTFTSDSVSQSIVLSEINLGYDLDDDGILESEVTATATITGLGIWVDLNSDGLATPEELFGGALTTRAGQETVGIIRADEGLFDE